MVKNYSLWSSELVKALNGAFVRFDGRTSTSSELTKQPWVLPLRRYRQKYPDTNRPPVGRLEAQEVRITPLEVASRAAEHRSRGSRRGVGEKTHEALTASERVQSDSSLPRQRVICDKARLFSHALPCLSGACSPGGSSGPATSTATLLCCAAQLAGVCCHAGTAASASTVASGSRPSARSSTWPRWPPPAPARPRATPTCCA